VIVAVEAATLLEQQQPMHERLRGARKAAAEELGHRLVEIEQHGHPGKPQRQRGEHEEIGQGVDLDQGEPLAAMEPNGGDHGARHERQVLAQVHAQACALVTLHVEVVDPDAVHLGGRWPVGLAQPQHLDRAPGTDQRFRLAPDARILLVVAVDDHEHRAPHAGARTGRHARVDQPAPSRRTWRSRVVRPAELSTVSITSSARS
jgi:hypothetical protein